jgi:UrcA family protein
MRKNFINMAAAAAAAVIPTGFAVAAEAAPTPAYEVGRVQVSDLDLQSAAGRGALTRRARAVAARVCGLSPARGAADHASLIACRQQFVQAVHAAADVRTGEGAGR